MHPVRLLVRILLGVVLIIALGVPERSAHGQGADSRPKDADERAARLDEMALIARSIKITAIDDRGETPAVMSAEPVHRWTDPTRAFSDGGLWVWRAGGRPVAVVGIELYAYWSLEFVALSNVPIRGEYEPSRVRWSPPKDGVKFREIADAPAPGSSEAVRLRQMRELAKRFAAREYWNGNNGQHYALRLLPHPIDRYSAPASGVIDGGLFMFAHGTNPEALLILEARRQGDGPAKWSFAAVPLSHAELALKVGAKDVWTSPNKDTTGAITPSDPYYDVLVPRRRVEARAQGSSPKPPKS